MLSLFMISGCAQNSKQPEVHVYGALSNIMHKGDLSATYALADLTSKEHVYALGALEGLKGEIMIWNGQPFISSVKEDSLMVNSELDHNAALLVYSEVETWKRYPIPDTIKNPEQLEHFIDAKAEAAGFDMKLAFPFLITGDFNRIRWHVINWKTGDKVHTHEKHKASGLNGQLNHVDAEILGFYSRHHHTIFTHHSTNMHMHVKADQDHIYGHADLVVPGSKNELWLPTE